MRTPVVERELARTSSASSSEVVLALLAEWSGSADAGTGDGEGERADARPVRPGRDRERQALLALRQRWEALPFGRVHPSWVAAAIPSDPLLTLWCLAELPRAERLRVLRELPTAQRPALLRGTPPPWFAAWWHRRLRSVIAYPWPVSEDTERSAPFTYLDRLPAADLTRLLRCFGLRALAAAMRELDRDAVVALALSLPAVSRDRLATHSKSGRYPEPAPWAAALTSLHREAPEAPRARPSASARPQEAEARTPGAKRRAWSADVSLLLALEDVGAQAVALGEELAAARIAYRLPVRWGERLLARLARGAGDLAHPRPEHWQRDLVTDLGYLSRSGVLKSPVAVGGQAA